MAEQPSVSCAPRVYILSKLDAAVNHLDWAIRLIVDHGAYDVAITVAGAAEEVLGKAVAGKPVAKRLNERFQEATGLSEKAIADDHLNRVRNWLKHNGPGSPQTLEAELEVEAVAMVARCLVNLVALDNSLPSESARFRAWLRTHMPHLPSDWASTGTTA